MLTEAEIQRGAQFLSPAWWAHHATKGERNPYQVPRHIQVVDRNLTALIDGELGTDTLIVEAPPRHGKSELISKWLPAWYLGRYPDRRVLLASYEHNFARSWGMKARNILRQYGREWWDVGISDEVQAASDWDTTEGGGMNTAGVGGPLTGRGGNLIVIDDYLKNDMHAMSETIRENQWSWWQSTASNRLEPGGVIVVMATRWHHSDLIGKILKQARDEGTSVARINMPALASDGDFLGREAGAALWPERWPLEALEKIKRRKEIYWWLAQYQQRPGRHARAEWPDSYFQGIWADRWPDAFDWAVVGVDPSKGKTKAGDYFASVFVGLTGGKLYVDACMDRDNHVSNIVAKVVAMCYDGQHPVDGVGLEANAFQDLLAPEFDRQCQELNVPPLPIHLMHNTKNKELRITRMGPYLARQQLVFRDNPGTRLLVEQLQEFPLSEHDDGPDALELGERLLLHVASGQEDGIELEELGAV